MGRGRIGTSPPQTPSLGTFLCGKKGANNSPQKERNKIKACAIVKIFPQFTRGKKISTTPNGAFHYSGTSPPLQSLFTSRRLCSPYYRPRHKTVRIFSAKTNPLPSEVPKGAALLLCCYYIVKIRAIFNRPNTHLPFRGRSE